MASTVTASDLTVTITESYTLNGVSYGIQCSIILVIRALVLVLVPIQAAVLVLVKVPVLILVLVSILVLALVRVLVPVLIL